MLFGLGVIGGLNGPDINLPSVNGPHIDGPDGAVVINPEVEDGVEIDGANYASSSISTETKVITKDE